MSEVGLELKSEFDADIRYAGGHSIKVQSTSSSHRALWPSQE